MWMRSEAHAHKVPRRKLRRRPSLVGETLGIVLVFAFLFWIVLR